MLYPVSQNWYFLWSMSKSRYLHQYSQARQEHFHHHKNPSCCPFIFPFTFLTPPMSLLPGKLLICPLFIILSFIIKFIILSFQGHLYKQNNAGCNLVGLGLFLLSIIPQKFIQVVACTNSLFPFIAEQQSMVQMYHIPFSLSPLKDIWVGFAYSK